jgi:hypothetical protein
MKGRSPSSAQLYSEVNVTLMIRAWRNKAFQINRSTCGSLSSSTYSPIPHKHQLVNYRHAWATGFSSTCSSSWHPARLATHQLIAMMCRTGMDFQRWHQPLASTQVCTASCAGRNEIRCCRIRSEVRWSCPQILSQSAWSNKYESLS